MELKPKWFMSCLEIKKVYKPFYTIRVLLLFTVLTSLRTASQTLPIRISLAFKNSPIEEVFKEIKKQSGYSFVYTREQLKLAGPVTVKVESVSLNQALDACFQSQPFIYVIEEKYIAIRDKPDNPTGPKLSKNISGEVKDEKGIGINATVSVKRTNYTTTTNSSGFFTLKDINENDVLIISSVGFHTKEILIQGRSFINITLKIFISELDEAIIVAYGSTTRKLNTGNISKVTEEEISNQPVSNPLASLEGRVPGLVVTSTSGLPGSNYKLEIRGKTSVGSTSSIFKVSNDPLIIIDGIPYAPNNTSISYITSALNTTDLTGGLSPLASINPGDIESIEVLKDADATSIYGSRGANGVILITTKKGKVGKTRFNINYYSGISKVTRPPKMLNTRQYLEMRREAFSNDNVTPTELNAPDLMLYDTIRYTDYVDYFIGKNARTSNLQATITGGDENTQYLLGASYQKETTVFPGDFYNQRSTVHLNLHNNSRNQKLSITLNSSYSNDLNNLVATDFASLIRIPPNTPEFYDSVGKIQWDYKGYHFNNPMGVLSKKYKAQTANLLSSLNITYKLLPYLQIKASIGYNSLQLKENRIDPASSEDPFFGSVDAVSQIGYNNFKSWIIEPQLIYTDSIYKGTLQILLGSTIEANSNDVLLSKGSGFPNDNLLNSLSAAQTVTSTSFSREYKYQAGFARINYNASNRYIINITARRDGSSRFGDEKQFSNFGAVGAAWIFSESKFFQKLKFANFGKIRASFGTTGNDKIQDYQYLNRWRVLSGTSYQGIIGITPASLYNPSYHWERNIKFETAIDFQLFNNRLYFSTSYYRNRSDNQLVQYALPTQTGFLNVIANFPALVENTGVEIEVQTRNIVYKAFKWRTSAAFSIPNNKLIAFPNLETSSYSKDLVIGKPLSTVGGYKFIGIDNSGVYRFEDVNADGIINSKDRIKNVANRDPKFYGNLNNSITINGFQLDMFFEFRKQVGPNYLYYTLSPAGARSNQPVYVMDRWAKTGDNSNLQKFTTTPGSAAYTAFNLLKEGADISYTDASFIRFKNLAISYTLPYTFIKKAKLNSARIYFQAQNIFTITNYKGADPETQLLFSLPPLKTFTIGAQLSL